MPVTVTERTAARPDDGNDGSGPDSEDDEPDGEPDGDGEVDHRQITLSRLPLGGKPNPKSLTLRQFTGRVKPGDFDSGVGQWCLELDSQLLGAQMRDGHRWTEPAKLSIMQNLLAEEPAVWFYRLWAATENLTVKIACKKLREKYATKIGEDAIRDLIRSATRKPSESYEAYGQRLENMANALPGGIDAETNAAAALAAFVRMACPTHQAQLNVEWTQAQRRRIPARAALREMIDFISLLDRSNGIAVKPKASKAPARKKAKGKEGKAEAKGLAAAVVTERKRKPTKQTVRFKLEPGAEYTDPEWVTETTKCHGCHGTGHLARNPACPAYGQRKKKSPLMSAIIMDSGASYHLTGRESDLRNVREISPPKRFQVADGRTIEIKQVGDLHIRTLVESKRRPQELDLVVPNVFHVPGLSFTLLSVFRLVQGGNNVTFAHNEWRVTQGTARQTILQAKPVNGVYVVVSREDQIEDIVAAAAVEEETRKRTAAAQPESLEMIHRRLGHLNYGACRRLASGVAADGVAIKPGPSPPPCTACALAKATEAPAPRERTSSQEAADRVCHVDLAGPIQRSYHGSTYFMVVVWRDYVKIYGLRSKDQADSKIEEFLQYVARQASVPASELKVIRTDGGGEFKTEDFRKLIAAQGLHHQHSVRYRSSQNGVAERMIRTVTEMACAMLLDSRLPHYMWEDALTHATYIRNRVPRKGERMTPHEKLLGSRSNLRRTPVFGQSVVMRTPEPIRRKRFRFDGRGELGAFVGFSESIRGYKVYVPGERRRIRETAGVMALERMLYDEVVLPSDDDEPPSDQDHEDGEAVQLNDEEIGAAFDVPTALADHAARDPAKMTEAAKAIRSVDGARRAQEPKTHEGEVVGEHSRTAKRRSERIASRRVGTDFLLLAEVIREPLNLSEARRSPQWPEWEKATWVEIRALRDNDTYELVDLPHGARALDNTVQLRLKIAADGSIEKYKVRVCARGDKQIYLMDYVETRAPVIDLVCVKLFLTLVAKFNMHMLQGDVPAAYLKADLKETVYVKQVKGFEVPGHEKKVWRLKNALYGLKQAGREWNHEIDGFLKAYGLQATRGDECLYYKRVSGGLLLVCLYVDDVLVAHQDAAEAERLMSALSLKYDVKSMGAPTSFLGMRIRRRDGEIRLSQRVYIEETLHRFGMDESKPTTTPMVPKMRLDEIQGEPDEAEREAMRHKPYRQVVGSLLYLARVSRPDIAFAANQLARHCATPRREAWNAAAHLLRYLQLTKHLELVLRPSDDDFRVATDADWANDKRDRKSVSGFVAFLFGCPVHWGSTKQTVVTLSNTTAEFIAANDGLQQAEWIQLILAEVLGDAAPDLTRLWTTKL
ncbi:hypothetical protein ATCC90586_006770 [Pythium insidiosum]|nr:hypothetical protein ATCC90586_006770 [Pythium insidiosum]